MGETAIIFVVSVGNKRLATLESLKSICFHSRAGGNVSDDQAQTISDAELAQLAKDGDDEAARAFDGRWRQRLQGLCYKILGNHEDAEECVQLALFRTIAKIHTYNSDKPFESWILAIARNEGLDVLRRRREPPLPDAEQLQQVDRSNPLQHVIQKEEVHALKECLNGLPEYRREVIILVDALGYSLADAADFLTIPKNTGQYRRDHARKKLRQCLEEQGFSA